MSKRKYTQLTEEQKHQCYIFKARNGYNFNRIAKQFGVHWEVAKKAYLDYVPLPDEQERDYLRTLELARLEEYTGRAEQQYQDSETVKDRLACITTLIILHSKRADLNGLQLPKQVEHTHRTLDSTTVDMLVADANQFLIDQVESETK